MQKLCFKGIALFFYLSFLSSAYAQDPLPEVEALINRLNQTKKAPKVSDFLEATPTSWREYYTFMRQSKSRQGASPLNPRAIAFRGDGGLIMTFNGESQQAGYRHVELAMIRPETKTLELRDLTFCDQSSESDCQAKLSPPNPPKCQGCHGQSVHYNWHKYNFWEGAYGSQDDVLKESGLGSTGPEEVNFLQFKNNWRTHERYRHLVIPPDATAYHPYRLVRQSGIQIEHRANAHFTFVLLKQYAKVLARRIELATFMKSELKTKVFHQLANCPGYEPMGPKIPVMTKLADEMQLPLVEHWRFFSNAVTIEPEEVFAFQDGLTFLMDNVLANLLQNAPEYAQLIVGKGVRYDMIYGLYKTGETPSARALKILHDLKETHPMYLNLGLFNYLQLKIPPALRVDKGAFCKVAIKSNEESQMAVQYE